MRDRTSIRYEAPEYFCLNLVWAVGCAGEFCRNKILIPVLGYFMHGARMGREDGGVFFKTGFSGGSSTGSLCSDDISALNGALPTAPDSTGSLPIFHFYFYL